MNGVVKPGVGNESALPDELGLVHHCNWGLFYRKEYFHLRPSKSLQKFPNGCFVVGLVPPLTKKTETLRPSAFLVMHRRGSSHTRGGPWESTKSLLMHRAETEDENRGVCSLVFFLVCFCLYCMVGGGVGEVS